MKINFALQALVFATVLVCTSAYAGQITPQKSITTIEPLLNDSPLAKALSSETSSSINVIIPLTSAPPLSAMWLYAVYSSNCGWEYMTVKNQSSTVCHHGGAQMRTATLEIGYGSTPIGWMQAFQLPQSAQYLTTAVCIVNGYYTWPCSPGYVIVGFVRYYDLDGYQNGEFQFQDTSTNSPFNTLSTQINIL